MLSDQLQFKDIDMSKAAELVTATMATLCEFRSDGYRWDEVLKYTNEVANLYDIEIVSSFQQRRKQILPKWMEGSVVFETTGVREAISSRNELKVSIYLPIIDCMLTELRKKFSDTNMEIMQAIQSCNSNSAAF